MPRKMTPEERARLDTLQAEWAEQRRELEASFARHQARVREWHERRERRRALLRRLPSSSSWNETTTREIEPTAEDWERVRESVANARENLMETLARLEAKKRLAREEAERRAARRGFFRRLIPFGR